MNKLICLTCLFSLVLFNSCEDNKNTITRYYSGKIGDFPIEMELSFNGNKINGKYFYIGKTSKLLLSGLAAPSNEISLVEIYNDDTTGYFNGKITKHHYITGSWNGVDHELPFYLEEVSNNLKQLFDYTGTYGKSEQEDAHFDFLYTGNDSLKFQGSSYWIGDMAGQVHLAEVAGMISINKGNAFFEDDFDNRLDFHFENGKVHVKETGHFGGSNVSLEGTYMKTDSSVHQWQTYNLVVLGKEPLHAGNISKESIQTEEKLQSEMNGHKFPFKMINIPKGLQVSSELYSLDDGQQKEIVTLGMEGEKYGEIIIVPYSSKTSLERIESGEYIGHVQYNWAPADIDAWGTPKDDLVRLIFQSENHDMVVRVKIVRSYKDWLVENFVFLDTPAIYEGKAFPYKIQDIPEGLQVSSEVSKKQGLQTETIIIGFEGQQYGKVIIEPWRKKHALLIKDDLDFIDGKPYEVYPLIESKWELPKDDVKKVIFESKEDNMIVEAYLYYVYIDWFADSFKFIKK